MWRNFQIGNIPKLKHLGLPDDAEMAINCEWVSLAEPTLGCAMTLIHGVSQLRRMTNWTRF
jgi:hexokinase